MMNTIGTSLNDISYRQIIKRLTNGIDNINKSKESIYRLTDSHIIAADEMDLQQ
jgi:hypothetical protein